MQRLFLTAAVLLLCASASAQTTINITMPGTQGACVYTTGPILSNATPGQLQAIATSMAGAGCGGGPGGVTFGPASSLLPAFTQLPSNSGFVNFSFQALNATQCTGTVTGAVGGAFTASIPLCSGAACNALIHAQASFTNNDTANAASYNVAVTCTGTGTPATSTATVNVPKKGTIGNPSCPTIASSTPGIAPNFTQAGGISVFYYGGGGNLLTIDTTQFANIFGSAWPGSSGDNLYFHLPTFNYISAAFTVPGNYFTAPNIGPFLPLVGSYYMQQSNYSVPMSTTISTTCGDFSTPGSSGSTVVSGCFNNLGTPGNGGGLAWRSAGACTLTSGATYYLNFINADISGVTFGGGSAASTATGAKCGGNICLDPIQNGGNWSGYIPQ